MQDTSPPERLILSKFRVSVYVKPTKPCSAGKSVLRGYSIFDARLPSWTTDTARSGLYTGMASSLERDRQSASAEGDGAAGVASGFEPRATDVVIAVMGVTGAGKSTFISKCVTGPATPVIGHDIQACELPHSTASGLAPAPGHFSTIG